ncbi:MAG: magnesium transporter [Phycisphaerales bacterium]|jgi:magnesium transporter
MHSPTAELLAPDVQIMVQSQLWREIREILTRLEAADVAEVIDTIEPHEDAALAFRMLPRELAADVFSHLESDKQERLLDLLGGDRAIRLIESMDADDRVALLDEMPDRVAAGMVSRMSAENQRITRAILGYPEDSVGRLMTPDYVRVRPAWTAAKAIEHIRQFGRDAETVHWVYVTDEQRKLIDDIHIRTILLADPETTIAQLMDHEFVALSSLDDREEAVRMFGKYDRTALPVLDTRGHLLGIVTVDDAHDVAEEEFTEDIHKLGGLEALDNPYLTAGFAEMVKKRGGWLAGLFVMQLATIFVMSFFEEELSKAMILSVFIPLIISSGGNTGTQAASLLVRAIALGEVTFANWMKVASKELLSGLVLGSVLGLLGVGVVLGLDATGLLVTEHAPLVAITVGTAVVGIVIWGTLIGSLLPLLLHRLGLDPATSSSPLVATLMDVSGLTIYFIVAVVLLRGTLL